MLTDLFSAPIRLHTTLEAPTMADANAIFQHSWYIGNILQAILYGL